MFGCFYQWRHKWSFPRRREQFGNQRNVDVETCMECGRERLSPVQFGNTILPRTRPEPARIFVLRAAEEA